MTFIIIFTSYQPHLLILSRRRVAEANLASDSTILSYRGFQSLHSAELDIGECDALYEPSDAKHCDTADTCIVCCDGKRLKSFME
ncbi:hypothetical protein RRG08_019604 [Elysia crispata]|uniref:Uncharacterized protein n=1 Tax=Elysia crispata TaxID=231223 RepID=A0AAE1E5N7_9GAST|nr:hypothetical protein RRG08_019604 [Elysia crispata]